jgi:iron(III) transport system ATP-binding protein
LSHREIIGASAASDSSGGRALSIRGLRKSFRRADGSIVRAIDDVSVEVAAGEFVVLLGPSGCGKTTLLRAAAGLEHPDEGEIRLGDRALFDAAAQIDVPPEARRVGMVFQSYALWPHMSVGRNVAYPLRMRGVTKDERARRAQDLLDKMHIGDLSQQNPSRISGGQQQRVALARALVCGDDLILFDEPLSNVDAQVREYLRLEILAMQRELGFTALYVTHDQEEAMGLATRIAVVDKGRIAQIGTPLEVYSMPATLGVARFIGTANEIQGDVTGSSGQVSTPVGPIATNGRGSATGREVVVLTRPEDWHFDDTGAFSGTIVSAAFLGPVTEHLVELDSSSGQQHRIVMRGPGAGLRAVGARVTCRLDPAAPLLFDRPSA